LDIALARTFGCKEIIHCGTSLYFLDFCVFFCPVHDNLYFFMYVSDELCGRCSVFPLGSRAVWVMRVHSMLSGPSVNLLALFPFHVVYGRRACENLVGDF